MNRGESITCCLMDHYIKFDVLKMHCIAKVNVNFCKRYLQYWIEGLSLPISYFKKVKRMWNIVFGRLCRVKASDHIVQLLLTYTSNSK